MRGQSFSRTLVRIRSLFVPRRRRRIGIRPGRHGHRVVGSWMRRMLGHGGLEDERHVDNAAKLVPGTGSPIAPVQLQGPRLAFALTGAPPAPFYKRTWAILQTNARCPHVDQAST